MASSLHNSCVIQPYRQVAVLWAVNVTQIMDCEDEGRRTKQWGVIAWREEQIGWRQFTECASQEPAIQRRGRVRCQWNWLIVQSMKHMPRKTADAVVSEPSLIGINHGKLDSGHKAPRRGRLARAICTRWMPFILVDDRQCRSGQSELGSDLRPVAQASDQSPSAQFVGHHDLVTGIQPEALKLRPSE
jgi:hypothetical protein